jgi:hypothetical protein
MSLSVDKASKICSKCKQEKSLDCFGPHKRTKDKKNSWCRDCLRINMQERRKLNWDKELARSRELYKTNGSRERSRIWGLEHKEERDAYYASPKGRFSAAKASAKNRKLPWNISFEDYIELISHSCYYCNDALNSKGIGLDRIDNNPLIGYRIDNVVPCCPTCNWMRQDSTVQEFKSQIIKIAKNLRLL